MIMVCQNTELTPEGHQAMGIGVAYAIFATEAEAKRWQLESGKRATTHLVDDGLGWD